MRVKDHGTVVAEIPNTALVGSRRRSTTVRRRSPRIWTRRRQLDLRCDPAPRCRRRRVACSCSPSPTIASKRWVYRQYDHMVRTNTIVLAGHGRRCRPRQGNGARAGDVGRRQRPLLLSRSASRRDARCRRSGAKRGVCRRDADRRDQLPELRQSRNVPRSCGSSSRRSKASPTPAGRSTFRSRAATSASTTRPTARRSIRRRSSVSSA